MSLKFCPAKVVLSFCLYTLTNSLIRVLHNFLLNSVYTEVIALSATSIPSTFNCKVIKFFS